MGNFAGSEETKMEKAEQSPFGLELEKIRVMAASQWDGTLRWGCVKGLFCFFFFLITQDTFSRSVKICPFQHTYS